MNTELKAIREEGLQECKGGIFKAEGGGDAKDWGQKLDEVTLKVRLGEKRKGQMIDS